MKTGTSGLNLIVEETATGVKLRASGDWTLENADILSKKLNALVLAEAQAVVVDVTDVRTFDTSGAWLLVHLQQQLENTGQSLTIAGLSSRWKILMDEVGKSASNIHQPPPITSLKFKPLVSLGHSLMEVMRDITVKNRMLGRVVLMLFFCIRSPRRLRVTSIISHLEYVGFRAVPIVALISFLIGGIIAQQSAFQLRFFGAEIFTVDLLGILVLREIGVLLTAIMVAGRSGSAFTAEIGSMKMREEIDALQVIGLSYVEVLVLPRVLALVIALPLLTVISDLSALFGGGLVAWWYVDIAPAEFMARLREAVWLETLLVGFIKAPFMAFIIAVISCSEGLSVKGSAESLGRRTTASVVKAIFMVIVVDGVFAIFFAAIGY